MGSLSGSLAPAVPPSGLPAVPDWSSGLWGRYRVLFKHSSPCCSPPGLPTAPDLGPAELNPLLGSTGGLHLAPPSHTADSDQA